MTELQTGSSADQQTTPVRPSSETSVSHGLSANLSPRMTRVEFAEMVAILCESKLHVELTKPQMLVWYKLLSPFDARTIREAILKMACRSDPFPNAGAIYEECRRIKGAADEASAKRPRMSELNTIADALGWKP